MVMASAVDVYFDVVVVVIAYLILVLSLLPKMWQSLLILSYSFSLVIVSTVVDDVVVEVVGIDGVGGAVVVESVAVFAVNVLIRACKEKNV